MIRYLEIIIRIIIVLISLWFIKNLYHDLSSYLNKSSETQKILTTLYAETHSLSDSLERSKKFYEENQKVIEETRIQDSELYEIAQAIFKNITDKKLGFFTFKDISTYRDVSVINVYSISGILNLNASSLFSFEDVREIVNSELSSAMSSLNKSNRDIFELTFVNAQAINEGTEYKFDFNIVKKHTPKEGK